jgi:quercetin dioxygenase-like cupin family protein
MQFIKTDANVDLAENIVETASQTVTHLVIPAGKTVPKHHVPYDVIVVPIKGKVVFGDVDHGHHEALVPGDIVKMAPGEWHDLKAVDDTEVMVIKSKLQ